MDIKKWFETGTGLKIKEIRYLKMPTLPYNIFLDDTNYTGADSKNNIIEHDITIEHYSDSIENSDERIIEDFLNQEKLKFSKSREWLQDESMFVTIFEIDTLFEKIRKEK